MLYHNLDNRLSTVASFVRQGSRVADIGCDHAYLICNLIENNIVPSGIASDIKEGPLSYAKQEIERCKFSDMIVCRLGDGLSCVSENEVDDIVIAGMGGENIRDIIDNSNWSSFEGKRFILQPMTKPYDLRIYLLKKGFSIIKEKACIVNNHPYVVILSEYTGNIVNITNYDLYAHVGELSKDLTPETKRYLRKVALALARRRNGLLGVNTEEADLLSKLNNKIMFLLGGH